MEPGWPVAQILGVTGSVGIFLACLLYRSRILPLLGSSCCINLFSLYVTLEYRPFMALEGKKWVSNDNQMENSEKGLLGL